MDGENRREEIIKLLSGAKKPLSGGEVAKVLGVSRQVIVQDMALLRAANHDILSTNKGYCLILNTEPVKRLNRTFKVCHEKEEILDELFCIVDLGGKVLDVVVEHSIYGKIMVDLVIVSRADAKRFVERVNANKIKPLNELTKGVHYHTVEADSVEILKQIEAQLDTKGYLIR